MLPSYLLAIREGLEAVLIIGILLGALRKFNRTGEMRAVWAGTLSAVALSVLIAALLTSIGATLEEPYEQIFEGTTMLVATGVLTWMVFWMRQQARHLKGSLEAEVQLAGKNGRRGLFAVAFLAVIREGIELALLMTAAAMTASTLPVLLGVVLGLATAAVLGWGLFASTIKLDLRRFFQVTSILLVLFAAGLVAHGVHEFNEIGVIPALVEHVWDINFILDENSFTGQILKALFGYNGNPSLTEILAYLGYFLLLLIPFLSRPKPASAPQKA